MWKLHGLFTPSLIYTKTISWAACFITNVSGCKVSKLYKQFIAFRTPKTFGLRVNPELTLIVIKPHYYTELQVRSAELPRV
jgi:hypothetical protein